MEQQATRRTVFGRMAASGTAVLLAAHGGGSFVQVGHSEGTPVTENTREDGQTAMRMNEQNRELWKPWFELWNGDLAVADELIAPNFVAHFAPAGNSPAEVRGPQGLKDWIAGAVATFTDYSFTTTVGPLADDDMVAGRWLFRATYTGGIPGSSPTAVGQSVEYEGADIFRVENGQIAEYWLSADILQMLQQIGVIPA